MIVLRVTVWSTEVCGGMFGANLTDFCDGTLEPFACFCVALRSVEVRLERTSTAFIEASFKPFASFWKIYVLC